MANTIEVKVPDIGGFSDVSVIDVLVSAGEQIDKETPLITLETEKAAMDVPSPQGGKVTAVNLKKGDKVSEGSLILTLESAAGDEAKPAARDRGADARAVPGDTPKAEADEAARKLGPQSVATSAPQPEEKSAPAPREAAPGTAVISEQGFSQAHASPSIRKFARELGADLGAVKGSGIKGRITQEDIKAWVKRALAGTVGQSSGALPKLPVVDFAKFGPIEVQPMGRIQKISSARLHASWVNLPHVTQHEDADITDLEQVRKALRSKAEEEEVKLTPLAFIVRACIEALKKFPRFNCSLDASGENLVYKKYYNIGFAADTPNGLMVPVIANADRMDLYQTARALGELSARARAGKLKGAEMQGGTFTISSLGGIGGTAFTPIINAPEVAILGVSKAALKPVYERGAFLPRLMLPLSLSYDHRVIDGAEAARFAVYLSQTLSDVKALL